MKTVGELRDHLAEHRVRLSHTRHEGVFVLDKKAWPLDKAPLACVIAPTDGYNLAILPSEKLYDSVAKRYQTKWCDYTGLAPGDPPRFPHYVRTILTQLEVPSTLSNLTRLLAGVEADASLQMLDRTKRGPVRATFHPLVNGHIAVRPEADLADDWWYFLKQRTDELRP